MTAEKIQLHAEETDPQQQRNPIDTVYFIARLVGYLYIFLVGIELIGGSFKVITGGAVGGLFQAIGNPLVGLMIGMCATALLQSSSTTTSIIVGLVASGGVSVPAAIPMIMGANIGTSVTNTLVSLGHLGERDEFKRAFAGATIHDFFNVLSVLVLLPLEYMFGFIQKLSAGLTGLLVGGSGATFTSPLNVIIKPVVKAVLNVDKGKIKAATLGKTIDGSLIKGGLFSGTGLSDQTVGIAVLFAAGLVTVLALLGLVRLMKKVVGGRAGTMINKALEKNAYVSMAMGAGATAMVQSSSITTSTFVPMVGVGLVSLEAVFPLTLGANIGTTVTAMLASLGSASTAALQIALCHLLFNIIGILIWYPLPFMRAVPLSLARGLAEQVSHRRYLAFVYIGVVFFALPIGIILLSRLF